MSKGALLMASVLTTLALIEGALWVLDIPKPPAPPPRAMLSPDLEKLPKLGPTFALMQPNTRGLFKGALFTTNSDGFRGREYAKEKIPGLFRTIVIGDSFTMGSGVAEEDTYVYRLERLLDVEDLHRDHEVLNLGMGGFNLHAAVERLQHTGLKYAPDLVVYGWTHNDIEGPFYRQTRSLEPPVPESSLRLVRWLQPRWGGLRDVVYPGRTSYLHELDENYFDNPEAWSYFLRDLDELAHLTKERGICGVVFLHTGLEALNWLHPYRRYYQAVTRAAEQRGLFVAASFPYFRGHDATSLWLNAADQHPNVEGHAILANALLDGLRKLPASCGLGLADKRPAMLAGTDRGGNLVGDAAWVDESATYDGYTLLLSPGTRDVYWAAMDGTIVKSLRLPWIASNIEQLPSGNLLAVGQGFVREVDPSGGVVSTFAPGAPGGKAGFHHDAIITPKDTLIGITHVQNPQLNLWVDGLVEVDRKNNVLWRWNALDHLDPATRVPHGTADSWLGMEVWLHANSVDLFPDGDVLLSLRNLNRLVRIDYPSGEIIWSWGDEVLGHQHSAKLLENGHITVFDNGTYRRPPLLCDQVPCQSRALELDPQTGAIVWQFTLPLHYSMGFGDVDRLPNGNTLITYGQQFPRAKVIEVTPSGRLVWSMESHIETQGFGARRPMLYRAQRVREVPGAAN